MGEFPSDILIYHILPRLPAKFVIRFKCVSKQWQSFLTTREFTKMHLRHITNNEYHTLIFISNTTPRVFGTLDCEAPDNGLSMIRPLPFDVVYDNISILASCNGLVCVGLIKNRNLWVYSDFVIWNPVTSEYKVVSKNNSHPEGFTRSIRSFEMFYISSQDDYKLLHVTQSRNVYIYSLRYDSWRKVESEVLSNCCRPSAVFNDKLYTFGNCELKMIDLNTEELSEIATPRSLGDIRSANLGLMVLRGNLYIWKETPGQLCTKTEMVVLWKMDEDGDWSKVIKYYPSKCYPMDPLHLMKNGNWLVYTMGNVYKVDMKKNTNGELHISIPANMHLDLGAKYIETFVSPNQYVEEPNP